MSGLPDEIIQGTREEARRTLQKQLQTLDDIDNKAIRILRVNLIIISIILTVVSTSATTELVDFTTLVNLYTGIGVLFLLSSTAFAALTYTGSDMMAGLAANEVRNILQSNYDVDEYQEELLYGYANWIDFNYETNVRNLPLITLTNLFIIWGMTFFALGVANGLFTNLSPAYGWIALAILIIFTYVSGIIGQSKRWVQVVEPVDTFLNHLGNTPWLGRYLPIEQN